MTKQHTTHLSGDVNGHEAKSPFPLWYRPSKAAQLPKIPIKMAQHTRGLLVICISIRRCILNYLGKQNSVGRLRFGTLPAVCHPVWCELFPLPYHGRARLCRTPVD